MLLFNRIYDRTPASVKLTILIVRTALELCYKTFILTLKMVMNIAYNIIIIIINK